MEGRLSGLRKGAWSQTEDELLRECMQLYGEGKWHLVPQRAGFFHLFLYVIIFLFFISFTQHSHKHFYESYDVMFCTRRVEQMQEEL